MVLNCMNLEWQIRSRSIISTCRRKPSSSSVIFSADKGEVNLLPYRTPPVPLVPSTSSPGSVTGVTKQTFIGISQRERAFNNVLHFKLVLELS